MFNLKQILKQIVLRKKQPNMETNQTKMTYKELRKALKAEMKQLTELYMQGKAEYMTVRSKHIAYSMFRGRTFEQVESSWKHPESWINAYVKTNATTLLASYKARVISDEEALRLNS